MAVKAGLSCEFGIALPTFESLLGIMGLHMTSQCLLVLERCSAIRARKTRPRTRMESLMDGQMVLPRECLVAVMASVPVTKRA